MRGAQAADRFRSTPAVSVFDRAGRIRSVLTVLYQILVDRCKILWVLFEESHVLFSTERHCARYVDRGEANFLQCSTASILSRSRVHSAKGNPSTFASMVESPRGRCATCGRGHMPFHSNFENADLRFASGSLLLLLVSGCSFASLLILTHLSFLAQERFTVEVTGAP